MSETDFPSSVDTGWPTEAELIANTQRHTFGSLGRHSGLLRRAFSAIEAIENHALSALTVATIVNAPNGSDITAELNTAIVASGWPSRPATILVGPGNYLLSDSGPGYGVLIDGGGASSTPPLDIILHGVELVTTDAIEMFRITNSIVSVTRVNLHRGLLSPNANGAVGVRLHNAELCTITSGFAANFAVGVKITGTSTYNTLLGGEFSNMKCGVSIEGVAHHLGILGVTFAEGLAGGPLGWIDVPNSGGASTGVVINGCRIRGNGATQPVVNIKYGESWALNGNEFQDCATTAIYVGNDGSSHGHTLGGNSFVNGKGTDILIDGGRGCVLPGNRHGTRGGGTTVSTYFAVEVKNTFGGSAGAETVIVGFVSDDTGTALANAIKIAAGATNCVVIGSARIASSVPAGTVFIDPAHRATITGSRGGNAALADLLTKGATAGLWIDGSS